MTAFPVRGWRGPLRLALVVDTLFELGGGLVLLWLRDDIAGWLGVPERAVVVAGVLFLVAFAALGVLLAVPVGPTVVRLLAVANMAGGVLGWLLFGVFFGQFAPEGRWLLAAFSDGFLLIGVAEWVVVRRGVDGAGWVAGD